MIRTNPEDRLDAPAARRNRDPIRAVLADWLGSAERALEVASGTGQHVAHLAAHFPHIAWQPSDIDALHRRSIRAWTEDLGNVLEPLALDATADDWAVAPMDAVLCINMIHIAPWAACLGLLANAARTLADGGILYLYGPYMLDGRHTAESNARFDAGLRTRDQAWGIRDLADVQAAAAPHGLDFETTVAIPANNLSVIFRKTAPGQI